jgi:hypothetical protein
MTVLVPALIALEGGRFEAVCATCSRRSPAVHATSTAGAWAGLAETGWTAWMAVEPRTLAAQLRPRCPVCSRTPNTIADAVTAARKNVRRRRLIRRADDETPRGPRT